MNEYSGHDRVPIQALIQTTLPKPWEVEQSFHDVLYDWMGRAPWLAISSAAHLLVFFILMAIPWDALRDDEDTVLRASLPEPEVETFDEPEEPIEPELEPTDELEEPVLKDADEVPDDSLDVADSELTDDVDFMPDINADPNLNNVLGIGAGWGGGRGDGGKYGKRGTGGGGQGTQKTVEAGLQWLKEHQSPDGFWDADGFTDQCGKIGATKCDGLGHATHDIGLTGLALLAFLGHNSTTSSGPYKETVARGIGWLKERYDEDTGLFGDQAGRDFLYDHALATIAVCEAYHYSKSPLLKPCAQGAVHFIQRARNPYAAWRYDAPPIGVNDTSVTGWMIFALIAAKDAGLVVDQAALDGGMAWIEDMTDPATGRVGYDTFGSASSRTAANEHFPREKGEAMTAVGLLCRAFTGQKLADTPVMEKHAALLVRTPPEWDPDGYGCDMYYWYYGSYALFQLGGKHWKQWERSMKAAVVDTQRHDGDAAGSWDPVGPWGHVGGRVYSTALMTLTLEVYYRYGRMPGMR